MEDRKYNSATVAPMLWSRYSTYLVVVVSVLLISALLTLKVEAEVAIFHSDTYLEQGVEVLDESGSKKHIQYEHLWSNFKGAVPEGVEVNNIALRFMWSSVTRSVVPEVVNDIPVDATLEISSEQASSSEPTQEELVGESTSEELLPELESDPREEAEPTPGSIAPESEEINEVGPVLDLVPEENDNSFNTEGFEQVSQNQLYSFANAQLEAGIATDTTFITEEIGSEVIIAESISTTSGFVSSDIIVENLNERFFEVRYTTDGATWNTLGTVGFDESHDTVFDLSHIGLEALSNLQIAIRYTVPEGDQTKIIFDSMRLEVGYGAPLIVESAEPITVNDNEPNFDVSSVKTDVQSENIRAVMLERGGVLEFWYSLTEQNSGEIVWNRLVGGSSIDGSAPIAIKERTIFWLDRNQQTLFGFSVDNQSLFGVPFQNPEEKVFQLPFQDDNAASWEATFDSELNTLEFHKKRKESS